MVSELFGENRNKLIGMSDSDFFGLKHTQDSIDNLVISNKQCIEKEETLFFNNSNETRVFLSVKKPLYGKHNKIVGLFGISTDITKHKETENKLNIILDNVAAYIYILSTTHQFIYANKMTQTLLQLPMEEIKGKTVSDLLGDKNGIGFQRLNLELLKTKEAVEGVETFISGDITSYFWTVKAPLYDEEANITSIIGMSTDITKQVELEKHLEQANENLKTKIEEITKLQDSLWEQATQDPLTKLFNRRYFNEHIEKELQRNKRSKQPVALLLIDADYFKKINDTFGHNLGDTVLIKLSKIMIGECRRTDIICRFGGEEFIILMPNTNQKTAFERAEKIRLRYQKEISDLLNTPTTLSVGIAMWSLDYENSEGFIKAADLAMYQAKENGRNQVVIYD
jgi:diguanylate cyclase (GGDEF)-like protein/PAS domain S-box-containing protein